jgi:hypothetical protein
LIKINILFHIISFFNFLNYDKDKGHILREELGTCGFNKLEKICYNLDSCDFFIASTISFFFTSGGLKVIGELNFSKICKVFDVKIVKGVDMLI